MTRLFIYKELFILYHFICNYILHVIEILDKIKQYHYIYNSIWAVG